MTTTNKLTLLFIGLPTLVFCMHAVSEDMVRKQNSRYKVVAPAAAKPVTLWKEIDPCDGELICQLTGGAA